MAATFELFADSASKYRFRLKASNGEIVAQSEAYESKGGAQEGIDAVRRAAADAEVYDLT